METLSVRCNHCGAPLQIGNGTRFVTCQFCQSNLEVKRTDSSVFTEEVAKIAENTGRMAESLEVIELQNEIERLDREHEPEMAAQATAKAVPTGAKIASGAFGVVFAIVFTSFGLFFATDSAQHGAPLIFQIAGGGFAVIGIIMLITVLVTAFGRGADSSRPSSYSTRRDELVRKLETLRKS